MHLEGVIYRINRLVGQDLEGPIQFDIGVLSKENTI